MAFGCCRSPGRWPVVAGHHTLNGVRLVEVETAQVADVVTAVHEASASVAYAHIFTEPFPRLEVEQRWSTHAGRTVLALRGEVVVGFAASSADGTLEGLYVLPGETGTGLGTALLDAIAPVSRLWVLEANAEARAFYERRGWRWSGTGHVVPAAGDVPELLYVRD